MSNSKKILVESVTHTYKGGKTALKDINLEIGTGLFGLLGANGAGKSTLMRIICTLLTPSAGRVLVNGRDVVRDRRQVRASIGYLSQEFGAWRLFRVEEVLDTLARFSGLHDTRRRRARVAEVLESVGLNKVADRKVKKLSGGMLRRLGVAQALVHEPEVLVVDEPTVGLDPEERLRFRQLMSELSRDRIIVLSTHIVADLGAGCASLALINAGRLEFSGSPAELIGQASGKVLEVAIAPAEEARLAETMEVVARTAAGGGLRLRGVVSGRDAPPAGAVAAENITLEEAYLAFMLSRGHEIGDVEVERAA